MTNAQRNARARLEKLRRRVRIYFLTDAEGVVLKARLEELRKNDEPAQDEGDTLRYRYAYKLRLDLLNQATIDHGAPAQGAKQVFPAAA
jgi:hypothetical protein